MASLSVPCPKCTTSVGRALPSRPPAQPSMASFPKAASHLHASADSNPFAVLRQIHKHTSVTKLQAQLGEVAVQESSNSIPKSKAAPKEDPTPAVIPDAASINAFMTQASDLIKLVDSRDIVELELKQQDWELLIRKKEAIPLPPAPIAAAQPSYYAPPPPLQPQAHVASAPAPSPAPSSSPPALPAPAAAPKASASSHPPLKCPMAGTFYRCPGPGEPPFVKVGDKVQKGQVICIIEAMKLMNEIEADQSGTVAEVLMEDGKPVSVDTPLFVIVP